MEVFSCDIFVINYMIKFEIKEEYIDVIFPGDIKGKVTYDKQTGEFVEFNYYFL